MLRKQIMDERDSEPYGRPRRQPNRCNQIDTHELLKREIYRQGADDLSSGYKFGLSGPVPLGGPISPLPPVVPTGAGAGIDDTYLYFDSLAKDSSSDLGNGEITWSITNLNNSNPIENIVEMQVGDFWFPLIKNSTGFPDYYFYRRVYMYITTLPSQQAVLMQNSGSFHFEFDVDIINSVAVHLKPVKDTFYFKRPITSLSSFTARFLVPSDASANFKKIPIPTDKTTATLVGSPGTNPSRWHLVTDPTSIIGDVGALASPGVAMYFSGVSSNNSTFNSTINSSQGAFADTVVDGTDFTVTADATAVTQPPNVSANIIIPKNRVAFQMRFTSVRDYKTNYLEGSHN